MLFIKKYRELISKYTKKLSYDIALLALVMAFQSIVTLVIPKVLSKYVDELTLRKTTNTIIVLIIIFITLNLFQKMLSLFSIHISQKIGWKSTNRLRSELLKHCINLDIEFFKDHNAGELVDRIDGDASALFDFFALIPLSIINSTFLLLGTLFLLLKQNIIIGIVYTIYSLLTLQLLKVIKNKNIDYWTKDRKTTAEFYGFLEEHISCAEDIRANGAQTYSMNRFYSFLKKMLPIKVDAIIKNNDIWRKTYLLFVISDVLAYGLAAVLWKENIISVGTVYLIITYSASLKIPIEDIRAKVQDLQRISGNVQRIDNIFENKGSIVDGTDTLDYSQGVDIDVDHVTFGYSTDNDVIKDISFHVKRGTKLGIVGKTGCGKTTITRLIARMYDFNHGSIKFNNKDIKEINYSSIMDGIAYVTQEVQLFKGSLRDNITFFRKDVSDSKIIEVIDNLGLTEWYNHLENGLDTIIYPNDGGISAGEAQLISYARSFLRNPQIIILDEATSRIDPITEKLINQAVQKLLDGRTCIIIAHKLETIKSVDEILYMELGEVKEYGNREYLSHNNKTAYYKLLHRNMEGMVE